MADPIDVACPSCQKKLKVPAQYAGKKIKCKACGKPIPVPAASPEPVAAPPTVAEHSGAKPAEQTVADPNRKVTWDDETDNDNKPVSLIHEDENPRCPHCAELLDPPDAIICVNCGFNNRTREKAETKKVYEPEPAEWFAHLAPGVLCVIIIVALFVLNVSCFVNMRYWMEGGILELEEEGVDGRKKFFIHPGFFISIILFTSIVVIRILSRIGYRRLFIEYMPKEEEMKEEQT